MKIVGCDLHTRYQQIAMLDDETGEIVERRLEHASGEAEQFYRGLTGGVRVGIEATARTNGCARLLAELGHQLWVGDVRLPLPHFGSTDACRVLNAFPGLRPGLPARVPPGLPPAQRAQET